jgi:hypothetical protein
MLQFAVGYTIASTLRLLVLGQEQIVILVQ